MRINKFLAQCGLGSRRQVEKLILAGEIKVNGQIITDLATTIQPNVDHVKYAERTLNPVDSEPQVWMFHKPLDCLCTRSDPAGRKSIFEYLEHCPPPFQAVGRLDRMTTGLLLITNDGKLSEILMHPRYEIPRIYEVVVEGHWDEKHREQLSKGVEMKEGGTGKAEVKSTKQLKNNQVNLVLELKRGKKREIRYSLQALGYKVITLKRTAIANLSLGDLKPGQSRLLDRKELNALKEFVKGLS